MLSEARQVGAIFHNGRMIVVNRLLDYPPKPTEAKPKATPGGTPPPKAPPDDPPDRREPNDGQDEAGGMRAVVVDYLGQLENLVEDCRDTIAHWPAWLTTIQTQNLIFQANQAHAHLATLLAYLVGPGISSEPS